MYKSAIFGIGRPISWQYAVDLDLFLLLYSFLGLSFEGYLLRFCAWVSQKQGRVRTMAHLEDHYPGRSASP